MAKLSPKASTPSGARSLAGEDLDVDVYYEGGKMVLLLRDKVTGDYQCLRLSESETRSVRPDRPAY